MGKRTSTLDWTDWSAVWNLIETTHGGTVSVVMLSGGSSASAPSTITALFRPTALPGSTGVTEIGVGTRWPNNGVASLDGLLYRLMLDLDDAVVGAYVQRTLAPPAGWYGKTSA